MGDMWIFSDCFNILLLKYDGGNKILKFLNVKFIKINDEEWNYK